MKIMLDKDKLQHLKNVADGAGIEFFATPMFPEAVDWLNDIGVKRFKIRYADRCNTQLLKKTLGTGKQVIISCDGSFPNGKLGYGKILLMYCIPEYPPKTITLPQTFRVFTGYSNHYPSIVPPLAAAARGAKILEVHVKQKGTEPIDGVVSITFEELTELVRLVREMEEVVR
jgi:sialic acid synthase SpsE